MIRILRKLKDIEGDILGEVECNICLLKNSNFFSVCHIDKRRNSHTIISAYSMAKCSTLKFYFKMPIFQLFEKFHKWNDCRGEAEKGRIKAASIFSMFNDTSTVLLNPNKR